MITVACVLRSGGDFSPEWVYALKRGLNEHLPEHRFICLTDVPAIPNTWARPLRYDWRGWWAKMMLFDPKVFKSGDPVFYMDLDTLIEDDPSDIASYPGELGMIKAWRRNIYQSGVMVFRPGEMTRAIWEAWIEDPAHNMRRARGDGEWLNRFLRERGTEPDDLRALYPGQIVSYKIHSRDVAPEGARLVLGHGRPRFSSPRAGWAHERWLERVNEPG